ncbi:peptidoglycan-binding domain-containing protein [Glycomyces dulcitolivorans]|uniref:peptidoglycan-binding domain-containing protein n=1 Tax=Glycomyces dulcitolivorans TaxID=2200759 RepID=UPI0013004025|nr:hypothetical protein [Glycomyces dulcitolivorans]
MRQLIRIALVSSMAIAMLFATATTASAGTVTHSWSDNPELCNSSSCTRNGNVVRAWQTLVLNNVYGDCGNVGCYPTYGCWFVDGAFGSNTAAGTEEYQDLLDVTADGWVGSNTWGAVYDRLVRYPANDSTTVLGYYVSGMHPAYGSPRTYFKRDTTNGYWYFQDRCDGGLWKAMSF